MTTWKPDPQTYDQALHEIGCLEQQVADLQEQLVEAHQKIAALTEAPNAHATVAEMIYPSELTKKAQYELHVFERVGAETGAQLLAEVLAWRERFPEYEHRPQDECVALKLGHNAELSGPRPLATEGSRSNDVLAGTNSGKD